MKKKIINFSKKLTIFILAILFLNTNSIIFANSYNIKIPVNSYMENSLNEELISIRRQLEAQGKMEHFELHKASLFSEYTNYTKWSPPSFSIPSYSNVRNLKIIKSE